MADKEEIARQGIGAIAAWLRLEAAIKECEAAALTGDSEALETARQRAHELLDAHIDLKTSAHIGLTRNLRG